MKTILEKYRYAIEGQHLDRKEAKIKEKDYLKHIVGFANAEGGTLVMGINDNGKVTGCKMYRKTKKSVERSIFNQIYPTLNVDVNEIDVNGDYIIIVDVPVVLDEVVKIRDSDEVYLRQSDSTDKLKYNQIRSLEFDKGKKSFEDERIENFDEKDWDNRLFEQYRRIMNTDKTNDEILNARANVSKNRITVAAVLMFAKDPSKYLPQSRVKLIRYDGTKTETGSRLNIVKEEVFEQSLPLLVEEIKTTISSQLREFNTLSKNGHFIKVPEYPEFAWLEGVVNAIVHRDYSIAGDYIKIFIYDDRLEIVSPGKLPSIVTLENLKYTRFSRNPRIARLMSEFGYVKEINEEVNRIFDEMSQFFLEEPEYTEPNNRLVSLKLKNNIIMRRIRRDRQISEHLTEDIMLSLNDEEREIVQFVYPSKRINLQKAMELTGKKVKFTRKLLQNLVKKQILYWHGSSKHDPTQFYSMYENE